MKLKDGMLRCSHSTLKQLFNDNEVELKIIVYYSITIKCCDQIVLFHISHLMFIGSEPRFVLFLSEFIRFVWWRTNEQWHFLRFVTKKIRFMCFGVFLWFVFQWFVKEFRWTWFGSFLKFKRTGSSSGSEHSESLMEIKKNRKYAKKYSKNLLFVFSPWVCCRFVGLNVKRIFWWFLKKMIFDLHWISLNFWISILTS